MKFLGLKMFKKFLVNFLWGALSNLMGFPILENDEFNLHNAIIVIIGCVILSVISHEDKNQRIADEQFR